MAASEARGHFVYTGDMSILTDESFGIVPVCREKGIWKVLLIHQISHRGQERTFWTLPKGHAERGESGEEAALRELKEETGLSVTTLERAKNFKMEYTFKHGNDTVEKIVYFYLGYCEETDTSIPQPDEVLELGWFTFAEAEQRVTHNNSRQLLSEVQVFLNNQSS